MQKTCRKKSTLFERILLYFGNGKFPSINMRILVVGSQRVIKQF